MILHPTLVQTSLHLRSSPWLFFSTNPSNSPSAILVPDHQNRFLRIHCPMHFWHTLSFFRNCQRFLFRSVPDHRYNCREQTFPVVTHSQDWRALHAHRRLRMPFHKRHWLESPGLLPLSCPHKLHSYYKTLCRCRELLQNRYPFPHLLMLKFLQPT